MKKFLSLLICVCLTFTAFAAFAEPVENTETDTVTEEPLEQDPYDEGYDDEDYDEELPDGEEPEDVKDYMDLKVKLNGTSVLSYTGAIEESYHDMLKEQYEPLGYTVEPAPMGERTSGLRLTKETPKGEKFNLSMPGGDPVAYEPVKASRWFYDVYAMNAKFDMSQYPTDETLLIVNVTLPVMPTYNNADSNKFNTYTWELKGQKHNSIEFIVLIPNFINIAIGLVALIIIIMIIFMIRRKKKAEDDMLNQTSDDDSDRYYADDPGGVFYDDAGTEIPVQEDGTAEDVPSGENGDSKKDVSE